MDNENDPPKFKYKHCLGCGHLRKLTDFKEVDGWCNYCIERQATYRKHHQENVQRRSKVLDFVI